MKAYRDAEGHVRLFRPDLNIKRLNKSLARLHFPPVDEAAMIELIRCKPLSVHSFQQEFHPLPPLDIYVVLETYDVMFSMCWKAVQERGFMCGGMGMT